MTKLSSVSCARRFFLVATLALGWFAISLRPVRASDNALADYVNASDDSFAWHQLDSHETNGFTVARLELISQTWRSNVWKHQLLVVRPAKVRNPDIALLFISGNGDVTKRFSMLRELSERAGAVTAFINNVPNQPLYDGRKEDALIAFTFDQYNKTGDRTWPLLFPMTKSAVRGMDAVQAWAQQEFKQKIERFVTTGASKRGWTTWLTGAVDPRVKGIAPMVIDMLNMKTQTQWAEKMYGRQSEQIRDYENLRLIERQDQPRMVELRGWVDPYSHRASYTMPKLLLLGTNDPYWVVDSLRHYWNDLPEPKLVFQTPNAGHDLGGGREATETLAEFFQLIADHQPLPQMTWKFDNTASNAVITVNTSKAPKTFRLWTATSTDRDLRNDQWSSVEVAPSPATHAIGKVATPSEGYRAYLVEAEFVDAGGHTYKLSTEAHVTPDGPPTRHAGEGR